MITLRKLTSLPEGTKQRKILSLIRGFEQDAAAAFPGDSLYLTGLLKLISEDEFWNPEIRDRSRSLAFYFRKPIGNPLDRDSGLYLRRELNGLGHSMAGTLGRDWADWESVMPLDADPAAYIPGREFRVYLDGLRSPFNVGSIMRTSMAFGAEKIWVSPECTSPDHRRSIRSAMGAVEALSWESMNIMQLDSKETGTVFALELGGTDVADFSFPESGTVILGSEELGVHPRLLEAARNDGGVVSIPLAGAKASLNVGVAFGILMDHWNRSIER